MERHVLDMVMPIHKRATIVQLVNIRIKREAQQHPVKHVILVNRPPQLPWRVLIVLLDKAKKKVNNFYYGPFKKCIVVVKSQFRSNCCIIFFFCSSIQTQLFQRSTVVINAPKEKLLLHLPPCV